MSPAEQRAAALRRANEVRVWQSRLRQQIAAQTTRRSSVTMLADTLDLRRSEISCKVVSLLLSARGLGAVKTRNMLRRCRIRPDRPVKDLTDGQAEQLINELRAHAAQASDGRDRQRLSQSLPMVQRNLASANRHRLERAASKRHIRGAAGDGREVVARILLNPPDYWRSAYTGELLRSMHRVGGDTSRVMMNRAGIVADRPVGMLTQRQRVALAVAVCDYGYWRAA